MKEYGGYIELDTYRLPMLHEGAIALNCGRNALAYLIRSKRIRRILLPFFLCASVRGVCDREGAAVRDYSVGMDLLPARLEPDPDEWVYLVNYYGQQTNDQIRAASERFPHLIVDNAQAYFQMPVEGVDTLYTCRKFFGVSDGAFLYSNVRLDQKLERDESYERMHFLLGRFERNASEFYPEYVANNQFFADEPIKQMSRLTENLLHGIDYAAVKERRERNFNRLHERLGGRNGLRLRMPEGPFMYPFYSEHGGRLRSLLQKQKIYIPTLWPNVLSQCGEDTPEARLARNILPLPCDQRYDDTDMDYICSQLLELMSGMEV